MGGGILLVKNHSLAQLLSRVYPEFKWENQSFVDVWTDEPLAKRIVEWLKKQSDTEISYVDRLVREMGKKGTFPLTQMLIAAFPQYKWVVSLPTTGKKSQYMLRQCLGKLFTSDTVILEEYHHPDVAGLELDYFFPQYNLAFEYQV